VEPKTNLETERARRVADRDGARDRARRAVERGEEAVPRRAELSASEPAQLTTDEYVVLFEEVTPTTVAEIHGQLCRPDDVGEEDGREHPVERRMRSHAGQELLDLVEDGVLVAEPGQVVGTGELDDLRAEDPFAQIATELRHRFVGAMQDE
jgi:hypothetical protein